jgi:hypothetical protein
MFKRLNTGGAELSPQEIRNCSVRMIGDHGVKFYSMIVDLSKYSSFIETTSTLASADIEQKANEELVLRFFATKNYRADFKGSVRDWLDDYMEAVLLGFEDFHEDKEVDLFKKVFDFIKSKLGESAFVKFRGSSPIGGLAPAYFEAIAVGIHEALLENPVKAEIVDKSDLVNLVQSDDFRSVTGPGANSKTKLEKRIRLVKECFLK